MDGHGPPSRSVEEPLRALLESLRNDLGDDRMREYKVLLSAAGITSVQVSPGSKLKASASMSTRRGVQKPECADEDSVGLRYDLDAGRDLAV